MIHRRLLDDDAFGVQEPLNEIEFGKGLVARGKHFLIFDSEENSNIKRTRQLANQIFHSPIVTMDNVPGMQGKNANTYGNGIMVVILI